MTALAADRNTPWRDGTYVVIPAAADTLVYAGAQVCYDPDGNAVPGATAPWLHAAGRAEERVDNRGGAAGARTVTVRRGIFRWANSAGIDAIDARHIDGPCYVVDDQTVAATSGSGTRSPAGIIVDVDEIGVWVDSTWRAVAAAAGALVAANNLADVTNAHSARANIGANQVALYLLVADLRDTVGETHRFAAPVAGAITALRSVLGGSLIGGEAVIAAAIGGVPVTGGNIVIETGSIGGDVDVAIPTGANVVAAGDVISLSVQGNNGAHVGAAVTLTIET